MDERVKDLIMNLTLLEHEINQLPDTDEFAELIRLNDEIQDGMLYLFEDFMIYVKDQLVDLKDKLTDNEF